VAGGLVLTRSGDIDMVSEDLFVSAGEIRVRYIFRNRSDKPIRTEVAFPMPDRDLSEERQMDVAYPTGFQTEVVGRPRERIGYILTTGGNWRSPIGDFRLVVDKGAAANLVSFCGEGVRKISPTRFEIRHTNWRPDRDLKVLIVTPAGS
jgi:hypothetical protein